MKDDVFGVAELNEVLDALPSLVAFVDSDERNRYVNRAARTWVGRTPEQVLGRSIRELVGAEGYAALLPQVRAAMAGSHRSFERAMVRPDGRVVHTVTEYLPRFRHGRPDGFTVLVTDVSRQVQAELRHAADRRRVEELQDLNRTAAEASDVVLQELFAIGLHLERLRRFPEDAIDVAVPVLDALAATIDRLRTSIKGLLAEGERSRLMGTIGPERGGSHRPTVAATTLEKGGGDAMTTEEDPVVELTEEECWELLETEEFGRLAYRLVDEVHLVPINYVVDGRSLLFRTTSGNKLLAAALHSDVALEIDWHDDHAAWSVVARGRMRQLEEDEAHRVESLPLRPWVPTLKYDVVELRPEVVTGRRFLLQRPEPDHELTTS